MLFLTEALWAHFGCTVAPDDSCAAPSRAVVPISSSLGRCSRILVGVDIVAGRRNSEDWQLDTKAKGAIRSLNAEDHDHACEVPEGLATCVSVLIVKTVNRHTMVHILPAWAHHTTLSHGLPARPRPGRVELSAFDQIVNCFINLLGTC